MLKDWLKNWIKFVVQSYEVTENIPLGGIEAEAEFFKDLFPEDSFLKCIATGFNFVEGPVWIAEGNYLLFSDIPENKILKLNRDLEIEIFRAPSGNSNGLARDKKGRLIACEHSNRRVTRTEKDGSITVLADSFKDKKLNSPNDVIVKSDGSIYFTDPSYGIESDQQEQPVQGVYRISPDGKEIKLIADDFGSPNGLAFSLDENKLYIGDSSPLRHIRVFDVKNEGTIANSKIFYNMNIKEHGNPDGMKIDSEGNLFCTGARGVWVFNPDGIHLGTILTPEIPSNCTWGDEDFKSLYITAETSIYKIRTVNPGNRT